MRSAWSRQPEGRRRNVFNSWCFEGGPESFDARTWVICTMGASSCGDVWHRFINPVKRTPGGIRSAERPGSASAE